MRGALATLGCLSALVATGSAFVMPGASRIVSGRSTRSSTSQVIVMGRGDTRTPKGKRMRHSYGKCRPRKRDVVVEGDAVAKAAPVARRWDAIEYVESEVYPVSSGEDADTDAESASSEVEQTEPFVSTPESVAAAAAAEDADVEVDAAVEEPAAVEEA